MIVHVRGVLAALSLLFPILAHAQGGAAKFPWSAGDPPPAVAGVTLGLSRAALDSLLGKPARVQTLGTGEYAPQALSYPDRGLSIIYSEGDGVQVIFLLTPDAGTIDGLHVGDERAAVLAKWGGPTLQQEGKSLYFAAPWLVVVRYDDAGTIGQLGLGRVGN